MGFDYLIKTLLVSRGTTPILQIGYRCFWGKEHILTIDSETNFVAIPSFYNRGFKLVNAAITQQKSLGRAKR